jgi:hypothetical protein
MELQELVSMKVALNDERTYEGKLEPTHIPN